MKDLVKLSQLIDFYGKLLTEKQYSYLKDYYFNDLTLNEIGEKHSISKNAIYDSIKKAINELNEYDNKLNLIKSFNDRMNLYNKFNFDESIKKQLLETEVFNYGQKHK